MRFNETMQHCEEPFLIMVTLELRDNSVPSGAQHCGQCARESPKEGLGFMAIGREDLEDLFLNIQAVLDEFSNIETG